MTTIKLPASAPDIGFDSRLLDKNGNPLRGAALGARKRKLGIPD
ncbi:hypothetical protein [Kovacikia minuta]|nr:hypothetical protein [Kovacikia minuta]